MQTVVFQSQQMKRPGSIDEIDDRQQKERGLPTRLFAQSLKSPHHRRASQVVREYTKVAVAPGANERCLLAQRYDGRRREGVRRKENNGGGQQAHREFVILKREQR